MSPLGWVESFRAFAREHLPIVLCNFRVSGARLSEPQTLSTPRRDCKGAVQLMAEAPLVIYRGIYDYVRPCVP